VSTTEHFHSRTPTVATQSVLFCRGRMPDVQRSPGGVQFRSASFGGAAVEGRVEIADIAWLQVMRMTAASHRLVHRPSAEAGPAVVMWLQVRGTSVLEQQGRSARLVPGRWSLVSSLQPYTMVSDGHTQRLVLLIPPERIHPPEDLETLSIRSFSATAGLARLAFEAARAAVETASSRTAAADLAESVCRLVDLALQEGPGCEASGSERCTLEDRVRSYIEEHLSDPDLSLEGIARSLNVSKRSLHRAVRDGSDSLHELIWHARLQRCRDDLLAPAKSHLSIGEIAHSWGFKNLTHFSRAFRQHFGTSARDLRRFGGEALAVCRAAD
jgi:AraC-like DNA-binding protein